MSLPRWRRWAVFGGVMLVAAFFMPLQARAQIDQAKPDAPQAGNSGGDAHPGMKSGSLQDNDIATMQRNAVLYARQNRAAFEQNIRLDQFRLLATEHLDQKKIIDSWARQSLRKMRHRESIDGKDPVYLALDMALRPEYWVDKNIIYVESVPIREELGVFATNPAEVTRIRQEALVSPAFLLQEAVWNRLAELSRDSRQVSSVNKVYGALDTFMGMGSSLCFLPPPPAMRNLPWANPYDVYKIEHAMAPASVPAAMPAVAGEGGGAAANIPPYTIEQKQRIAAAFDLLSAGWQENDAQKANQGLSAFVTLATSIDPPAYPSRAKRVTELWYNRTFSGTIVAFVYFLAMTLFLLVALGISKSTGRVEKAALGIYAFALLCHMTAMGIRWWLDGRIPIQNQFESVLGSACIGCVIGLLLEGREFFGKFVGWYLRRNWIAQWQMARQELIVHRSAESLQWKPFQFRLADWIEDNTRQKSHGIFGTAFAFVGFLATTTLLAAPYVFGNDLGAAPGKVAGILNTYWLYIHVNIVIASYALIFASASIAGLYLAMRQWYWVNPIEPGFEGGDHVEDTPGGGAPRGKAGGPVAAAAMASQEMARVMKKRELFLDTLDQANMVVLQMAFWFLGIGIICGAIWADQSWGRPWGWDPKETFALVTWMVYLIIVHIRLIIKQKADTTAWLSLAGCGVMLFNWIGVNFWLAGLHSYA